MANQPDYNPADLFTALMRAIGEYQPQGIAYNSFPNTVNTTSEGEPVPFVRGTNQLQTNYGSTYRAGEVQSPPLLPTAGGDQPWQQMVRDPEFWRTLYPDGQLPGAPEPEPQLTIPGNEGSGPGNNNVEWPPNTGWMWEGQNNPGPGGDTLPNGQPNNLPNLIEWVVPHANVPRITIPSGQDRREAERAAEDAATPPTPPTAPAATPPTPPASTLRPPNTALDHEVLGAELGKGRNNGEAESIDDYLTARLMTQGMDNKGSNPRSNIDELMESAQDLRQSPGEFIARLGFGMAAGDSPFLFHNIGNAGIAALDARDEGFRDYQAAIQDMYTLQEAQRSNMAAEDNSRMAILTQLYGHQQAAQAPGENPWAAANIDAWQSLFNKEVDGIMANELARLQAAGENANDPAVRERVRREAIASAMARNPVFSQYPELIDHYLNDPGIVDIAD